MKQNFKLGTFLFFYITCALFALPHTTHANAGAEIGFSYNLVKPENQHSSAGYFDLRMEPGQKQTVTMEIFNDSDKEIVVDLAINSAKTNSNGVVEYGPTEIKDDSSLKYNLKDIAKIPEDVTVPPKSQLAVPIEITMPAEKFDGHISGGIQMKQKESEEEKKAADKATGVINKYAFIVGVLLSETDEKVQPDLTFNSISAGLTNYRNSFLVNFSNTKMTYVEGMTVDVQILKKDSDEVLYESKKANYRMAPNSMIDFPVNLNGEQFEAGDYIGHILVKSGDKTWEWKEAFKVTTDEADKYNGQDISLVQERGINWKLIALIVCGVVIVFIGLFILVRVISKNKKKNRKKKKKSTNQKNSNQGG